MSEPLRLVVVAQEFPFPPNHGGRADVWRRLRALHALGCQIYLVCWCEQGDQPTAEQLAAVHQIVAGLQLTVKRPGLLPNLTRLARMLGGLPSHAAARTLARADADAVIARLRAFGAQAVLLDSPYGGAFARAACAALRVPMFYRSHNIEHRYFAGQAAAATHWRKRLGLNLARWHLERFEQDMMRAAQVCFDISADDIVFWRARGIANNAWLPPLPEAAFDAPGQPAPAADGPELLFLGNLHAPNNVRGVRWLVEQVMPLVWRERPEVALTIAGSAPSDEVRALVAGDSRLRLLANVKDAPGLMASARVLLNPVLSGSGVNVKTLDMLMTERPIVSSRQGVAGLLPELQALCHVAEGPQAFAEGIAGLLGQPRIDQAARLRGRQLFSVQAIAEAMRVMQQGVAAPV
ncbi:glycosyltransferase family 4 protein [Oxalobacteraceae bacterium]|nr:glycosyltransferase family 4 protein [Oxalobacteraceae bacterium]